MRPTSFSFLQGPLSRPRNGSRNENDLNYRKSPRGGDAHVNYTSLRRLKFRKPWLTNFCYERLRDLQNQLSGQNSPGLEFSWFLLVFVLLGGQWHCRAQPDDSSVSFNPGISAAKPMWRLRCSLVLLCACTQSAIKENFCRWLSFIFPSIWPPLKHQDEKHKISLLLYTPKKESNSFFGWGYLELSLLSLLWCPSQHCIETSRRQNSACTKKTARYCKIFSLFFPDFCNILEDRRSISLVLV